MVKPRAATNWARVVNSGRATIATGAKVLLSSIALSNPGINEVIRRTRGVWSIDLAATGPVSAALGFIVVTDLALATGAAAIPGPITEASDDGWFVWQPLLYESIGAGGIPGQILEFDSKAMRRVPEGYSVAVMAENISPVISLDVQIGFSVLASRT